ncbi:MAG: hypothetical protein RI949_2159 [Pseudomonadota bacterium]|jgi:ubiquinone biosynthesis protein UbiJ
MIDPLNLQAWLVPAAMERLTLALNHVLSSEEAALDKMRPHAQRVVVMEVEGWPAWLPPCPALGFRITPAGLLEWCGSAPVDAADLRVRLDASNPPALLMQLASGDTPSVQVEGDAQLAADVQWLLAHVRWDVAADVERIFGPAAAHAVMQWGSWLKQAIVSWKGGVGPGPEGRP